MPLGRAVLNDLTPLDQTGQDLIDTVQQKDPKYKYSIQKSKIRIPPRIKELKGTMEEYLRKIDG